MPRKFMLVLGLLLAVLAFAPQRLPAAEEKAAEETPAQRDARMKWWREARFGMFIHWGVYSVPAGTYDGKQIGGIGEWIMHNGKIPVATYRAYAKQFNPVKFDADQWVSIAKDAGMKYMVITSKHHDGFGMFDSKATDWCITKATPFGRDPLKELAAACRKHGVRLGFYYSQAQDWTHPGGAAYGGHWDKAQDGSMDDYIDKIAVPQVREILGNYGEFPAVLWWDTPKDMTPQRAEKLMKVLKELKPDIIMNNRLGGGYKGDSETPEQFIPATGYPGRDWETCMTMNDTWGYKSYDHKWKSIETLIRNLVDIASKGGNYLLNVGPTNEGLIPEASVERLQAVGRWMKTNGESIYATTSSPFKKLPWGRCTKVVHDGGATLYLHVFDWPADGKLLVPGLKNETDGAYLLSDAAKTPLAVAAGDKGPTITLPGAAPDPICSVVVLKVKGELNVEQALLGQAKDGSLALVPGEAICHGEVKSQNVKRHESLGFWIHPADWVEWKFEITRPGTFDVTAELAALKSAKLELTVGDRKLDITTPQTGDYDKYQTVTLGKLELPAGKHTLAVKAVAQGWSPANIGWIKLKPTK